jgi:hypothetical protein
MSNRAKILDTSLCIVKPVMELPVCKTFGENWFGMKSPGLRYRTTMMVTHKLAL